MAETAETTIEVSEIVSKLEEIANDTKNVLTRDRIRALELLGKYKRMFDEHIIIDVKTQGQFTIREQLEARRLAKLLILVDLKDLEADKQLGSESNNEG